MISCEFFKTFRNSIAVVNTCLQKQFYCLYSLHKKIKFSINKFFSKCDHIRSFLGIWSHNKWSHKESLMENFIFCTAIVDFQQLLACIFNSNCRFSTVTYLPETWNFICISLSNQRSY